MNYEKKYNELIEKLKKAKIEAGAYTFKSVIDKYISELKESEDEKIRKALINFLKSPFVNENITDEKVNPWIAWLEKQGEEILILKDQIESLHAAIKAIKETYQIEQKKQYEQKLAEEYNITGINSKHAEGKLGEMIKRKLEMEKQGEQKPVLGMKTPEESLGIDSETYNKIVDECIYGEQNPVECNSVLMTLDEAIEHCDSKSNNTQCGLEHKQLAQWLRELKEYKEQKPVISYDALREGIAHFGITQYQIDNWLKKYIDVEKQGDRPKPKFNVGQTIKKEGFNLVFTIVKIKDGFYYNDMGDNFPFTDQDNWELVEQNPTWDEEDDQYLLVCENALRKYQTSDKWDADIISHWLENKLKAHQAIWKPSDDQIEILDMILTNESMDDNVARILRELREQLKKLKD